MTALAESFIHKMKTRDMRVAIKADFRREELQFGVEEMMHIIGEQQLPLDFVYDTIVGPSDARWYCSSSETTRRWRASSRL